MSRIEICCDHHEAEQFRDWLLIQGHDAEIGHSTANYVDGVWTSTDGTANHFLAGLWALYCDRS